MKSQFTPSSVNRATNTLYVVTKNMWWLKLPISDTVAYRVTVNILPSIQYPARLLGGAGQTGAGLEQRKNV